MATASKKLESELIAAATAFESELRRYEALVAELGRQTITSDKQMLRVEKSLEECGECETRLVEQLYTLARGMQSAQARQQSAMEARVTAAMKIEERAENRQALIQRVAMLGQRGREMSEPVNVLLTAGKESGVQPAELLASLREVADRTDEIIAEADAVRLAAQESSWVDIERDALALKQQLQSARNRLLLVQRDIASNAPS